MKFRKLRITWSVAWGILCLLLIVLWLHSYWYRDVVFAQHPAWGDTSVASLQGKVSWLVTIYRQRPPRRKARYELRSQPIAEAIEEMKGIVLTLPEGNSAASFTIVKSRDALGLVLPYWSLAFGALLLVVAAWFRWSNRFSLRTLLIGMTVAAIGLGWVLYAARN